MVRKCKSHRLTDYVLNLTRKLGHLYTLLLVGRRNVHREQHALRVDRHMNFAIAPALMAVVTRMRTAFAGGLQGASIRDNLTGLNLTLSHHAQHRTQIVDHGLEATRIQPTLRLLVDQFPRPEEFVGSIRHDASACAIRRSALNISRSSYRRCGACSFIKVRYGAAKLHTSSETSVGYGVRSVISPGLTKKCLHAVGFSRRFMPLLTKHSGGGSFHAPNERRWYSAKQG